MKHLMWLLKWMLKAAIFFTLFAFALNNQQDATVHFFFGTRWSAPLVLVVLTAFACGVAIGVLGMVPRWWKHRSAAQKAALRAAQATGQTSAESIAPSELLPSSLPRHGS
ncbi:MAG TPA: LapA family protein [Burkholderiaceae bacterium]|nr:LapA family protein [Burkholderiaceae bacterium]